MSTWWCISCPPPPPTADLGQVCVRKAMEGDVGSVDAYLKVEVPDVPGPSINFGTWHVSGEGAGGRLVFDNLLYIYH